MPTIAPRVKIPAVRVPHLKPLTDIHCVHCYQPLSAAAEGPIPAHQAKKHDCLESQLAKQPAAPVPFN